jgi:hypothetical protein
VRHAPTCTAIEMAVARACVCYHADRPSSNLSGYKVRFRARVRRLRLRRQPVPVPSGEVLGLCVPLQSSNACFAFAVLHACVCLSTDLCYRGQLLYCQGGEIGQLLAMSCADLLIMALCTHGVHDHLHSPVCVTPSCGLTAVHTTHLKVGHETMLLFAPFSWP